MVPGWFSNVDEAYDNPLVSRYNALLSRFARVIMFDKRGTGSSDRFDPDRLPSLDRRLDDVAAVLAAVGSDSAFVMGLSEGGPLAILLAATYPGLVRGLILWGSFAYADPTLGWPGQISSDVRVVGEVIERRFAEGFPGLEVWAPSLAGFEEARELFVENWTAAASPQAARAILEMTFDIDARAVLDTVGCPTLVLHRRDDRAVLLPLGEQLAHGIRGSRFIVLSGQDHWPFVGDTEGVVGEIAQFVTGTRMVPTHDRSLATVLFTDIVDSTASIVARGEAHWSATLEVHDTTTAEVVERHRGRVVKSTGDGALVVFDAPARAIECASDLVRALGSAGIPMRAGIHTGEIERRGTDVAGLAVNIASRVTALARQGEVLVSKPTRDLIAGSGVVLVDRGAHQLKGLGDEPWHLYAVARRQRETP
jgi:class 3 adenylate cyclase/pimeloyl-ACP methyl ester carboxylesterase